MVKTNICLDCGTKEGVSLQWDGMYCDECAKKYIACDDCAEIVSLTDAVILDGVYYCDSCADNYSRCSECGDHHETRHMNTHNNDIYCDSCWEELYVCDHCDTAVSINDTRAIHRHDTVVCESCFESLTFECGECGNDRHNDESISATDSDGDSIHICQDCMDSNYTTCTECGDVIHCNQARDDDGDNYCRECYGDRGEVIHEYSYKPYPEFHKEGHETESPLVYYGVELEVSGAGESNTKARVVRDILNRDDNIVYMKHDGSVNDGYEIVTHPCTLAYHLNQIPYREAFRALVNQGYRSHQNEDCGLHVHISRNALGIGWEDQDFTIMKMLYIVEKHWSKLVKLSRRTYSQLEEWADRYLNDYDRANYLESGHAGVERILDKAKEDSARYRAVNLCNSNTVEIRMFRGTLKLNTFIATLQFVDLLVEMSKSLSVQEVLDLKWNDIVAKSHDRKELMQYYLERRLIKYAEVEEVPGEE